MLHAASDASIKAGKAVTVLTYLHGVRECENIIAEIQAEGTTLTPTPTPTLPNPNPSPNPT